MIIRSYSGRTISEALGKVKTDLGDQALIIETRTVKSPGLIGTTVGYEVVAALEHGTPATSASRPSTRSASIYAQHALTAAPTPNVTPAPVSTAETAATAKTAQTGDGHLSRELAAIRAELGRLAKGHHVATEQLGDFADRFTVGEMPDELSAELNRLVVAAGDRLPEHRRGDFLRAWLMRSLPCQPGIAWKTTRNIMVVGPTGVGKTTTIAKLAAQLVHDEGRKIGIITIDTYRVGAQDQLRAYADLLGVPLAVASTPAQFAKAMHEFADYDHVFIDTAGRSPADAARVHELRAFCRAASSDGAQLAVMLAIPATCGRAEFAAIVERFSILPLTHTVVTKLDECVAHGRLYGCLHRHHLEVAYFTTGQEVPSDIVAGDAALVVDHLLDLTPAGTGT
jgi:flagellar biosynthesis protein FlhF